MWFIEGHFQFMPDQELHHLKKQKMSYLIFSKQDDDKVVFPKTKFYFQTMDFLPKIWNVSHGLKRCFISSLLGCVCVAHFNLTVKEGGKEGCNFPWCTYLLTGTLDETNDSYCCQFPGRPSHPLLACLSTPTFEFLS